MPPFPFKCFVPAILLLCLGDASAMSLEQQRAAFLEAEQALARGNDDSYRRLARRLADYPLYPYLEYERLKRRLDQSGEIESYLRRYATTRYAGFLRRRWLLHMADNKRWSDLITHYRPSRDATQQCHYYRALLAAGKTREAFAGAEELWLSGASRPDACDFLFDAWRQTSGFTQELVWRRFALALKENNTGLASYLKRFVAGRDRGAADLWLEIHANPGRIGHRPDWDRVAPFAARIFAHGLDRLAGSDPDRALNLFQILGHRFALEPVEEQMIRRRLGLALAFNRHPQAYGQLAKVGDDEATVREWRVRAALAQGAWADVVAALDRLAEDERHKPQWLYWRGRAHEALGNRSMAEESYRSAAADRGFFGFLAAEKMNLPYNLANRPVEVPTAQIAALKKRLSFAAAEEWRHLDRDTDAKAQWWHAVGTLEKEDLLAAAKLAEAWGWEQVAIFTIARAEYWDDLDVRFPLSYRSAVFANADRQDLDPAIIYGLVRQESAFEPRAQSPAGARGLMQIMPGTGKDIARQLRDAWDSPARLFNPDINLRYGSVYYKNLLDRFGGNFAMAAAAYNAGPHRVERWRPAGRALPADIWIETIPFKETRRYVAAVLAYAVIYRSRLQQPHLPVRWYLPDVPPRGNGQSVTSAEAGLRG